MVRRSVMVVEDEGPQREALTEFLEWRGFSVVGFASGRDAVDWIETADAHLDAAVVDWHLPGVGGEGVVEAIRKRFPDVLVVVASGSPLSAAERSRARWTAALRKPFSLRKVMSLFAEHLGSATP
jgi:two-component system phosphate regulon response regulator PhoB